MKLSNDELKKYHDDGYLFYDRRIFDNDEIGSILSEIDRIIAGRVDHPKFLMQLEDHSSVEKTAPTESNPVRKVQALAYHHPMFKKLAMDPRILDPVESILGPNIKLYTDEYFCKNPSRGEEGFKAYPWHQDAANFYFAPADRFVTAWIALDHAVPENGCMQFIPRSHIYGPIANEYQTKFLAHPVLDKPVYAVREPGYAILHHGLNFHCSQPNKSKRPRRAIAFHYVSADTLYLGHVKGDIRITQAGHTGDDFRFMLVRGREFEKCA